MPIKYFCSSKHLEQRHWEDLHRREMSKYGFQVVVRSVLPVITFLRGSLCTDGVERRTKDSRYVMVYCDRNGGDEASVDQVH